MKRFILGLLLVCYGSAYGQTLRVPNGHNHKQEQATAPYVIHYTDVEGRRVQEREDLARYHEMVKSGAVENYRANKKTYQIGDRKIFKVRNTVDNSLYNLVFKLRATGDKANVWVDSLSESVNNQINATHWEALNARLNTTTPTNSINPAKGIIENNEAIFGAPLNIDGDGKVDALCYNIIDGYSPGVNSGYIAGYVTPSDLVGGSSGNNTDIIHLDTYPQLSGSNGILGLESTAAHEYQHWIMYKYDKNEISFINEGLSEYAEIMMGYSNRSISYYNVEPNVALTAWRSGTAGNVQAETLRDYERAGFFTTYLAGQIGPVKTGTMTRNTGAGIPGLSSVLTAENTNLTVADLMLNFHSTVLLNNPTIDPRFGFGIYTARSNNRIATSQYPTYDGFSATSTPNVNTAIIREGAATFAKWVNVTDFELTMSVTNAAGSGSTSYNSRAKVRAIIKNEDNTYTIEDFNLPQTKKLFAGKKKEIWLVMANVQPNSSLSEIFMFRYSAAWSNGGQTIQQTTVSYGDGTTVGQGTSTAGTTTNLWFSLPSDANGKQALRIMPPAIPAQGWTRALSKVSIANYYDNQFNGSTQAEEAPRDFKLSVWEMDATTRLPKETPLWTKEFTDARTYAPVTSATLIYQDLDLADYESALRNLPSDSIFVGIEELGTDENYMVLAPTPFTGDHTGYLYLGPNDTNPTRTWRPLNAIGFADGTTVRNMTLPIRVTFKLASPVSNNPSETPDNFELHQNYPNPFTGRSNISYKLEQSGAIELKVFDSLGREVMTLLKGTQDAGSYSLEFDASHLSSGLYFYTLSAGGNKQTHKMVIVK